MTPKVRSNLEKSRSDIKPAIQADAQLPSSTAPVAVSASTVRVASNGSPSCAILLSPHSFTHVSTKPEILKSLPTQKQLVRSGTFKGYIPKSKQLANIVLQSASSASNHDIELQAKKSKVCFALDGLSLASNPISSKCLPPTSVHNGGTWVATSFRFLDLIIFILKC